jgi:hypothetical protein
MVTLDPKGSHKNDPFRSMDNPSVVEHEPPPKRNDNPAIWDLVLEDIKQRDSDGEKKYGTRLQGFNGRDPLIDAYQEALDLVVYLRQEIWERKGR